MVSKLVSSQDVNFCLQIENTENKKIDKFLRFSNSTLGVTKFFCKLNQAFISFLFFGFLCGKSNLGSWSAISAKIVEIKGIII